MGEAQLELGEALEHAAKEYTADGQGCLGWHAYAHKR
jgi:hypothetical protein